MLIKEQGNAFHEDMTEAALVLVQHSGIGAFSMSATARQMRVTPNALVHRYENWARVRAIIVGTVTTRWIEALEDAWTLTAERQGTLFGLTALLGDVDDPVELRLWLAFSDLARASEGLAHFATAVRQRERVMVARSLHLLAGREPQADRVDLVVTLLDGLRRRAADHDEPLTSEEAQTTLATAAGWVSTPRQRDRVGV